MFHSLLLLCTLYKPIASVVLWPVTGKPAVAQTVNPVDRGSWNKSASFSNDTDPNLRVVSSPSLNATGQSLWNSPNSSLEQALWPSLDTYNNFPDQCLLWDSQCTGNRTEALDIFFNNSGTLYNMVYGSHCIWSRELECAPWLPSPTALPNFLDWLRQPVCVQSFYEYHTQHADQPPWTWSGREFDGWSTHSIDWSTIATTTSSVGCCGQCSILGGNVDVYYWPNAEENSDCVSIIGSSFNNPVSELMVTDDRGYPYWKAQTNPWGQNNSQVVDSITLPPQQALDGAMPNPLSGPTTILQARGYWQNNVTLAGNVSSSEAIATIGDFRCTSPSVCVGFSNLYAADACGALSTDGALVSYTLIEFAPGELSTIEIPAWVRANVPPKAAIRSFNFANLPCPPQSVMYAVEYKPAPGEPYRPVLSAPSRLSSLLPEWSKSGCIIPAALFNGVDPPRALKPAEILTPRVTQAQPTASVAAVAAPASGIRTNEPSKTANPSTKADNEATLPPDSNTRESGSEISDPSSSDPEKEDPEITGTKAAESGNSKVSKSNSNADPQDMRPSIPDPESTSADVSKANSPEPDNIDPKQANSQPTNMQEADPKVLYGQDKPEETQGSTPEVSNPYDPKTDTSSPDRSQPKVPGTVSNSADSTNEASENPPPSDYSTDVSDLDGKGVLGSNQQAEEVADPGTNSADSSMGESKHSSSQAQNSAESRPNNSPAANTEATDTDASDVKIPGVELNPFDVLPKKLTNANDVLSSTAVSGDRQHSTIDSPEREPSFRPENLKSLSSENHRNDLEAMANQPFLPQDSAKAVSSADSGTIARTRSKTMIAGELALSSQHSTSATSALSTADSGAIIGFPSKTTSTKDSIFVSVATGTSKESGSVLSSARAAASGLHLGSDGTSSSKYQGRKGNAATSVKAKSSGSSLLASQKHQEDNTLIGARGLLYGSCLYVLLWFLSWL